MDEFFHDVVGSNNFLSRCSNIKQKKGTSDSIDLEPSGLYQ